MMATMMWNEALEALGILDDARCLLGRRRFWGEYDEGWSKMVGREATAKGVYYTIPDDPDERKAMATMLLMLLGAPDAA